MEAENLVGVMFFVLFCILVIFGIFAMIDSLFIKPVADDTANNHCIMLGFNQYKSYSRIGLFSKVPVAIKCEYAERYTDLGVRTNEQTN